MGLAACHTLHAPTPHATYARAVSVLYEHATCHMPHVACTFSCTHTCTCPVVLRIFPAANFSMSRSAPTATHDTLSLWTITTPNGTYGTTVDTIHTHWTRPVKDPFVIHVTTINIYSQCGSKEQGSGSAAPNLRSQVPIPARLPEPVRRDS